MRYNYENVKDDIDITIDYINQLSPLQHEIGIKGLNIYSNNIVSFLYHLRQQKKFGIEFPKNNLIYSPADLNIGDNYFDSSFNKIEDPDKFMEDSPKVFWGKYIDNNTLSIYFEPVEVEYNYVTVATDTHNVPALIQRPDKKWDETEIVYIQTDEKPNRPLRVVYKLLKTSDDSIVLNGYIESTWVY